MSNLYNNIIALCNEKGIKGAKLCDDIGISKGKLTDLKMGRRTGLNATTAQKIASYFGVSVGYLLGEEERTPAQDQATVQDDVSDKRQMLIDFAKTVPEDKVEMIMRVIQSIVES
jgi:transcriptional regulator with XRE-family HTH domain